MRSSLLCGLLGGAVVLTLPAAALAEGVSITSYGHSALLIKGGGSTVLVNPFKAVACAAGLKEPRVAADVVLTSSRLLDEGAPIAKGTYLSSPGGFDVAGIRFEGFAAPHDRLGGRRFGNGVIWRWNQGGLQFAHLGGTAAPLAPEDKVLLGRPDVLILGIGGGAKVYDGNEAAAVVKELNPRVVIPVQYVRSGDSPADCDQGGPQAFLQSLPGVPSNKVGPVLTLTPPLADATRIELMP